MNRQKNDALIMFMTVAILLLAGIGLITVLGWIL